MSEQPTQKVILACGNCVGAGIENVCDKSGKYHKCCHCKGTGYYLGVKKYVNKKEQI